MTRFHIVGIPGSLRDASYSQAVLRSVFRQLPADTRTHALDIGRFPHYSADLEREALPDYVASSRAAVATADAVVIVAPEYNHGIPGVLKNTLDWLSRPAFQSCMVGKPVLFMTLSEGALGGVRAQVQLRETLSSMLCHLPPSPEIVLPHIGSKVHDGLLADEASLTFLRRQLTRFVSGIVDDATA